jgi:MFS family permease
LDSHYLSRRKCRRLADIRVVEPCLRQEDVLSGCVALFTLTSLFCGLAPTLGIMLSSRVLQGIAGRGVAPVAQAILADTVPPAKRASAFALYTIVIVTAPAIGPVLGGWITDNDTWRWIFFINIPIGILAFFLASKLVKDPTAFEAERASIRANGEVHIDGVGIALVALASGALEVSLDRGQIDDWFGSFGIAFITTASERREQFHRTNLGSALASTSQELADRATALTTYLIAKGYSGSDAATAAAVYVVYSQLQHQVNLLVFMDCFRVIAWLTLAAVPLLLLTRRFKPADGKAPAAH